MGGVHDFPAPTARIPQPGRVTPSARAPARSCATATEVKFGLYEIEVIIDEEEAVRDERSDFPARRGPMRPYQETLGCRALVDAGRAQFVDPAWRISIRWRPTRAVQRTDGLRSRTSPSKRFPAAGTGRDHSGTTRDVDLLGVASAGRQPAHSTAG